MPVKSAQTLVNDFRYRGERTVEEFWSEHLLRSEDLAEAKRVLNERNESIENLKRVDAIDPRAEWVFYQRQMHDYANALTRLILLYQVERVLLGGDDPSAAQTKIVAAREVLAGATREVEVKERVKLGTRTNAFTRDMDLWLKSFVLDLNVHCNFGLGAEHFRTRRTWNGFDPRVELLQVHLERAVPVFGVRAMLDFGASTLRLSARLVKQLLPGLSAELWSIHGLKHEISHLNGFGERQIRLNYGVRF